MHPLRHLLQEEWGSELRLVSSLRVFTLPIYFVLNVMRYRFRELHSSLACFAEDFIETHLRKPDFLEIRFLNTVDGDERHAYVVGNSFGDEDDGEEEARGRTRTRYAASGPGYRVLRFVQQVDRGAELEGERGQYFVKYMGRQTEAKEAEMMFWMPKLLVN